MRKIRIMAITLISILAITLIAGCRNDGIDKTKTQLYIGNYDGGYGREWLNILGREFEEMYADQMFEKGKKGVQIIVDNDKDAFTGEQLLAAIASKRQDVYFTQDTDYQTAVVQGAYEDITDIVTEKYDSVDLGDGLKTYSIEDKLPDDPKQYYNNGGKYYALPFAAPSVGIVYDVDLFCRKQLYFLKNGTIGGSIDTNTPEQLLNGNGLPETWGQFNQLMKAMTDRGVTPFTWSGTYLYQRAGFFTSVWANYEGYNDYVINGSFNGTLQNGPNKGTKIDNSNAYLLIQNGGRQAAIQACYDIIRSNNSKNFSDNAFKTTQSHTQAQLEFLFSVETSRPIAMLLEGAYWENEASGVFSEMAADYDPAYSQDNRRFAMMQTPRFTDIAGLSPQENDEYVLTTTLDAVCFINAHSNKTDLAKLFLKFFYTNASLSKFNSITGTNLNVNYKMSNEDYNAMTYFQKSSYDQFEMAGRKIISPLSSGGQNNFMKSDTSYFSNWNSSVTIDGVKYNEALYSFYVNSGLTVNSWMSVYNNFKLSTWPNI